MNKLNWGCGSIQPKGWINLDIDNSFRTEDPEIILITSTHHFAEGFFDMAVAHCAIQINEFAKIPEILKEIHRVLKPGGVLRISLPDILRGFQEYKDDNIKFFPNGEENIHIRFSAWLTWYSTTKTLLTQEALTTLLYSAGFTIVREAKFKETHSGISEIVDLDTRENECYFIEAQK